MQKTDRKWLYIACILLQSVVYGLGNPLTKVGFASITVLWCLAVRFTLASLLLLAFGGKKAVAQLRAAGVGAWLPNSLCMAVAYISCNLALGLTTATNVGFLMSLPVLFAPILSVFLLKRKYPFRSLPVQLAVVAGLYMLCCGGGTFTFGLGEALSLLCALSIAGTLVLSERSITRLGPVAMAAAQTGVTAIISVAAALCFDDVAALGRVEPQAWLVVLYLALICSCLAYVLQNVALSGLSASAVSLLQCTQPVLTALFSFLLLGERLGLMGLAGAAVILVCVVVENYLGLRRERQASEAEKA
ncbi:MAG: DMT family transporter [Clostridia bacterium]|nr:DMT family transporter [Clostridia bacterium]